AIGIDETGLHARHVDVRMVPPSNLRHLLVTLRSSGHRRIPTPRCATLCPTTVIVEPRNGGRMDDLEAIKQLKARYMRTVDTKDWDGFRNVFTKDAVWDMRSSGAALLTGADEIVRYNQKSLGDDMVGIHQGHMPEIELTSPTTATGIWSSEHMHRWPDGSEL